jgi:hypothetical protein
LVGVQAEALDAVPASSARWAESWLTTPSASGSENGTPSSTMSAPARSSAQTREGVVSGLGSPAVI